MLTKYLSREESPETLTLSLLVLITPNHLLILLVATAWAALRRRWCRRASRPASRSQLPSGAGLWILLLLGVLTAVAQYLLAAAYKVADATYLQPFGDLKVPLSAAARLGAARPGAVARGSGWARR